MINHTIDNETGEILKTPAQAKLDRAADGRMVPVAALTSGQFIDQLNDGQFSHDLHRELNDLAAIMNDLTGVAKKNKGKVVVTIDMEKEDDVFKIAAAMKVTAPKEPRPKTIMWTDENNNFTRFPPNQMQMFGVREK